MRKELKILHLPLVGDTGARLDTFLGAKAWVFNSYLNFLWKQYKNLSDITKVVIEIRQLILSNKVFIKGKAGKLFDLANTLPELPLDFKKPSAKFTPKRVRNGEKDDSNAHSLWIKFMEGELSLYIDSVKQHYEAKLSRLYNKPTTSPDLLLDWEEEQYKKCLNAEYEFPASSETHVNALLKKYVQQNNLPTFIGITEYYENRTDVNIHGQQYKIFSVQGKKTNGDIEPKRGITLLVHEDAMKDVHRVASFGKLTCSSDHRRGNNGKINMVFPSPKSRNTPPQEAQKLYEAYESTLLVVKESIFITYQNLNILFVHVPNQGIKDFEKPNSVEMSSATFYQKVLNDSNHLVCRVFDIIFGDLNHRNKSQLGAIQSGDMLSVFNALKTMQNLDSVLGGRQKVSMKSECKGHPVYEKSLLGDHRVMLYSYFPKGDTAISVMTDNSPIRNSAQKRLPEPNSNKSFDHNLWQR
jgi:hypothetical protein